MNEIVLATGLYVSKDLIQKLLGPTAEYIGTEMREVVRRNLSRIFEKAAKKAGDEIETPGVVAPQILREVVDGGSFCEDDLSQEYYAGLLASSRVKDRNDDIYLPLLSIIRELSSYQIRMHYLIYWHTSKIFRGERLNIGDGKDRHLMQLFIQFETAAIALGVRDRSDWADVVDHALLGLETKDLITKDYTVSGKAEFLVENTQGHIKEPGIIVAPSLLGSELFIRSNGIRQGTGRVILKMDTGEDQLGISGQGIKRLWAGSQPLDEELFN